MSEPFTMREAIQSLYSKLCPNCGEPKQSKKTFCRICYFHLPGELQRDIYKGINDGYMEALNRARTWLAEHPANQTWRGKHKTSEVEA